MSELTLCLNESCKKKNRCKRFLDTPDMFLQRYTVFEEENCEFYIEIKKKKTKEKLTAIQM